MLKYDLHMHSCLSPCADNNMTPALIAGMSKLAGLDVMAICDHNSAENLPAAKKACDAYGLRLLCGIEATTAEEIHVLLYFKDVETALTVGRILYDSLPDIPCDEKIYGEQLIVNEDDEEIGRLTKLLTNATSFDIYEIFSLAEKYGGIAVPAHIDKDSYSVLSALGIMPDDLPLSAVEVRFPERLQGLIDSGRLASPREVLHSSDAHIMEDIAKDPQLLSDDSCLMPFIFPK